MTKEIYSVPRGTSDILPEEVGSWQTIESKARQLFQSYNYYEIRTPCFEETRLFARSMGETTDVVNKQMLTLSSQRDAEYSYSLALRPEGTAGVLRSYIQNSLDRKEHLTKVFYIGPMFRGERPQKGRLRQFHQIGLEAIGPNSASPYLDAEVIALAVNFLKVLGLDKFQVKVNTLGSRDDRERFSVWLRDHLKDGIKGLDEDLQRSFTENVFRILDSKDKKARELVAELKLDGSYLSAESREYFYQVIASLKEMEIAHHISPQLVRGLDYYTHTVFEITDSSLGSQDALGAGGRYNDLAGQLGGSQEVQAIGFALGIERILLALNGRLEVDETQLSYYIIALDEAFLGKAFKLLEILRRNHISSDMNFRGGSVKSQMRSADKSAAKHVIILGEDEIIKNEVTIKNMSTGEQLRVALSGFESFVKGNS